MKKKSDIQNQLNFQDLMQYRIHEILLIASPYDAFILEQDGNLTEQILTEYLGMNLSYAPRVWNASDANSAFSMLEKRSYDLIIVMMRISDMDPVSLGEKLREQYPRKPLVLLAFDESEIKRIDFIKRKIFDEIFIWSGNANIFPAIIKCIEDEKNISKDIKTADVRLIILIEDTPKYYSIILPNLYKEIIFNTKHLINKSLNDSQKLLHMRGRPKILIATNYEEAVKLFKRYRLNVLGIITDLKFTRKNKIDQNAGLKLIQYIRKTDLSIPILVQSTDNINKSQKIKYSLNYVNKNSPKFFKYLKEFMRYNFGFGDFNFRLPNGEIIGSANSIKQLIRKIKSIPKESLDYHASNNHLSNWFAARGEFVLSSQFRSIKNSDFKNIENRRQYHLQILEQHLNQKESLKIVDFSKSSIESKHNFLRIGNGSLGGKARGLAFANNVIINDKLKNKFPEINFKRPRIIVITTSEFDEFMEENQLWDIAVSSSNNKSIENKFLKATLNTRLKKKLKLVLKSISTPIAIRSSGLLEDSQYKPLAGMYSTYMLPNSDVLEERLDQLYESIKRIYASTFFKESKSLMDSVSHRYEEEKMAIIIMEIIGKNHNGIFYPTISGVFQSFNYYPTSYMKREDGVGFLALGLGKTIAEGGKSLRFCPKYPNILPQFYSIKSTINSSQNSFFALDINDNNSQICNGEAKNLKLYDLNIAEEHKELKYIAGVISNEDDIVRDSLSYNGVRILNFSSILKYNKFPLCDILNFFTLKIQKLIGCPIEIEFAINIYENKKNEFSLLQVKPMPIENISTQIDIKKMNQSKSTLCFSNQVLGNGRFQNIKHIMYIKPEKFKREDTQELASKIGEYNKTLGIKNPYILIGPGRWGSIDPWLGIPITWEQIANAKTIIEIGLDSFSPDPSFGSHFFQNLTSLRIGYFTIENKTYKKNIDWEWIYKQKHIHTYKSLNIVELMQPILIELNGITGEGIIFKGQNKSSKMDEEESSGI